MKTISLLVLLTLLIFALTGCDATDAAIERVPAAAAEAAPACNYPRLNALATSLVPSVATNRARLDALAAQFDAVTLGISVDGWQVGSTGLTVTEYLARAKPQMARWVYIPAGFVWSGSFDCANHTAICDWQRVVTSDDWLRAPTGGYVTIGDRNNHVLNPTTGAFGRSGAYWATWLRTTHFTGVHGDVLTPTLDTNGGFVDTDGNQVSDRSEYGLDWLDATWRAAQIEWMEPVTAVMDAVGNGSWQRPDVYQEYLNGAFIEVGHHWRDPRDGRWKPDNAAVLGWQWSLAQAWMDGSAGGDTLQWVASKTLPDDAYWSQVWPDYTDAARMAFALGALSGGEMVLEARVMPDWCDECGVSNGSTSTAGGDWLGCPSGEAVCSDGVCRREFDGGAVFVNLTTQAVQITPPTGMRTIRGWYDRVTNHGGAWDGKLAGQNAQVLVRVAAAAPTATRSLEERVRALETAVFGR